MKKEGAAILIADDNPDILKLIQVNLEFEGYSTLTAADGKQALELAREKIPDLIILDILMPEMDGWQVLANLKEDRKTRDIPVILLTGVSMKEGKERGLIEGVKDYLTKPFNPLRLLEIVEDILSVPRPLVEEDRINGKPIKIGLICNGKAGLDLLKILSSSNILKIAGYCNVGKSPDSSQLARDLGIPSLEDPMDLLDLKELDLIIDARPGTDEKIQSEADKRGVDLLKGSAVEVISKLLKEQEVTRRKERSLVKELNNRIKELSLLNNMSEVLTSPPDLWYLLKKVTSIATRIVSADGCTVMMYNEEQEKFVVFNTQGLDEKFERQVQLTLSDPLVEEVMAMNRPISISRMTEWQISPPIREGLRQGMNSMAAIPLFAQEKLLGFILVFSRENEGFSKEDVGLLSILASQAGIAIENAFLYESACQKQHLVEKLLSKLIQTQEEERKLIATEIHDTIAQSLVGIHTRIQTSISLLKKAPEKLPDQLRDLKEVVSENVKEVRQIIFNLRPSSLDDLGLIPSLENYIKRFERETGIKVQFLVNESKRRLNPTVETAIFRIIQEALTNIKKHAECSQVLVRLTIGPKTANLRVVDNGRGFSWEKVTERFLKGYSHGLQGMKERVSILGGSFKVSTEEGKGTSVKATIPLSRDSNEDKFIGSLNHILGEDDITRYIQRKEVIRVEK